jgi:myo-inositol catabolism protein IolC
MDVSHQARAIVARQLALDAETAEVVQAVRARGAETVLLKGPAVARTLYPDPARRPYDDIDLLVEPGGDAAAVAVLRASDYTWRGSVEKPDGSVRAET